MFEKNTLKFWRHEIQSQYAWASEDGLLADGLLAGPSRLNNRLSNEGCSVILEFRAKEPLIVMCLFRLGVVCACMKNSSDLDVSKACYVLY